MGPDGRNVGGSLFPVPHSGSRCARSFRGRAHPGHAKGDGAYVLSRRPDFIIIGGGGGIALFVGVSRLFSVTGFFITIIFGGIPRFIDAWERGYFSGNKGIFVVPVWPVRLVLVIGALTVAAPAKLCDAAGAGEVVLAFFGPGV